MTGFTLGVKPRGTRPTPPVEQITTVVPEYAAKACDMDESETPPGFDSKLHAPNSPQHPTEPVEGHKIENAVPLHINANGNAISYSIIECDERDHTLIHIFYQPQIGSWRLIDGIGFDTQAELSAYDTQMLEKSTEPHLDVHYSEYTRFDHQGNNDKITIN